MKLVPCRMTMDLLGLRRVDMVDGLAEPPVDDHAHGGQDAITLFI